MDISVVIPVYNEEALLPECLRRVHAFFSLKRERWECVVVDDGSTDRTVERYRETVAGLDADCFRLLSLARNRGKGAAVRRGVLEASGRVILVTDVDLSAPIKESEVLRRALEEGYDAAIGSRAVREAGRDVQQGLRRRLAGRVFNGVVRFCLPLDFRDTQCGFKCFKHEAAARLFSLQRLDGFSFDVEVLYLAGKLGMRVKEVPVMWRESGHSKVRLLRDAWRMVKDVSHIRRLHRSLGERD